MSCFPVLWAHYFTAFPLPWSLPWGVWDMRLFFFFWDFLYKGTTVWNWNWSREGGCWQEWRAVEMSCKVRVHIGRESLPVLLPVLGHLSPLCEWLRMLPGTPSTPGPNQHMTQWDSQDSLGHLHHSSPPPTTGPLTQTLPGRITSPCCPQKKRQDLSKEGEKQGPWHVDKEDCGLWLGAWLSPATRYNQQWSLWKRPVPGPHPSRLKFSWNAAGASDYYWSTSVVENH